ncbi:MAG: guanylate kinase [Desulfobacterales bacterium]|jgi:guanylate kinase
MAAMPESCRRRGCLFILSAPSGAGKSTLCRHLLSRVSGLAYSVSATTRPPRPGEKDGVDYFFVDEPSFRDGIAGNRWAEWAKVHGYYYGTSAEFLLRSRQQGIDVLMDIDVEGARQIIGRFPEAVTIFIMPPSMDILKERLGARGTDDPETVALRLQNAREEIRHKDRYRHVIVNDRLEDTIDALVSIVKDCRATTGLGAPNPIHGGGS